MRTPRALLAALAIGSLLVAPATGASAKAKLKCPFLSDAAGDAHVYIASGPAAPAYDILGMDVATGKNTLVVALHLGTTDIKSDNATAAGIKWSIDFFIGLSEARLIRQASANNPASGVTYTDTIQVAGADVAGAKVAVDAKNIVWTLPRKSIRALTKGVTLNRFYAQTTSLLAHDYLPDDAQPSPLKYVDRTAACVAAG